jgi:hypothetical protein
VFHRQGNRIKHYNQAWCLASKKVSHRVWAYFRARVAWTMAAFNLLGRWGLEIDDENMVRLSMAEFSF